MPKVRNENDVEENKDMSEVNRIIDDENRARIIDQLTAMGVSDSSLLSDKELIHKLSSILDEEHKKNISLEAAKALQPLNMYASKAHADLKNKDFIERLFMLNIPDIFLEAFTDEDANIKEDEKLWEIVRRSGIYQYDNPRDTFRNKMINHNVKRTPGLPREFRGR